MEVVRTIIYSFIAVVAALTLIMIITGVEMIRDIKKGNFKDEEEDKH